MANTLVARPLGSDAINNIKLPNSNGSIVHPENQNSSTPTQRKPGFSYQDAVTLPLVDRFIDEPRPLKVAVIGGGISGIVAGILLPVKVPGIELTVYEKNSDFVRIVLQLAVF